MQIRLPIDTKSLFFNIKNDNEAGHTATVSTPIRQYGGVDEDLVKVFTIDENVVSKEAIADKLIAKSRVEAKIVKVLVFDRISVNGEAIDAPASFCMYVREETAASNVHCGRQKLHYPMSLKYSDSEVEVNNKEVLKAVAEKLKNYAFVVEAFEYNTDTGILSLSRETPSSMRRVSALPASKTVYPAFLIRGSLCLRFREPPPSQQRLKPL